MKIQKVFENPILITHTAVFLFGFSGLFGKFFSFNPVYIVLGRTVFAAISLFFFIKYIIKKNIRPDTSTDLFFFILQGLLLSFHWVCFFYSIQLSTVAVGLITFSTFPLFVTFMEPFFFKEKLYFKDMILAVLIITGTFLIIPSPDFSNNITKGAFIGILSGFTFALLAIVNRKNAARINPYAIAFYQNTFAAFFLFIPALLIKSPGPTLHDIPLLILLGVLCTALSHSLFIKALASINARTVSVITGLEPVWGILLALILLNEIPDIRTIAGGILIIGTSVMAGLKPSQ